MVRKMMPIALLLLSVSSHCEPAHAILVRHVDYNLVDEGFLDAHHLQTIARVQASRIVCARIAKSEAEKKMLSIFLHVRFEIPPSATQATQGSQGSQANFSRDYPFIWSEQDYRKAQREFEFLLKKSAVFLEDLRKSSECLVVLRLHNRNLAKTIRGHRLAVLDSEFMDKAKEKRIEN